MGFGTLCLRNAKLTNVHALSGIRTRDPSCRPVA